MTPHLEVHIRNAALRELDAATQAAQGAERLALTIELAWHLRQRDTVRALALVGEARAALGTAAVDEPARQRALPRLLLIEGEAKWLFADFATAEQLAREALGVFVQHDDAIGCADAHWLLALLMVDLGRPEQFALELERCTAQALRAGDVLRVDLAEAASARWAVLRDLHGARERWGHRFGADVAALHPALATWAYDFQALMAFQTGDFARALSCCLPMYELATDTGQLQRAIVGAANTGSTYNNLNDHQSALEWMERGLALARQTGWPVCIGNNLMQTAEVLRKLGRLDNAHELLLEALTHLGDQGGSRIHLGTLQSLGELELDRKNGALALQTFIELEQAAGRLDQVDMRMLARRGRAAALLLLERRDEALTAANEALVLAQLQGDTHNQIETLVVLARIHARPAGRPVDDRDTGPGALHFLQQALALAATMTGYAVSGSLLDAVGQAYAQRGDWQSAYETGLQATAAREKSNASEAVNRAIALQIRHDTERARAESVYHRALAASEAQRASALQSTSDTLERLSVIGQEITAHLDAEAIFNTLDRHVNRLLDATHFSIFLLDDAGLALDCRFGIEDHKPLPPLRVLLSSPISNIARCARERCEILNDLAHPLADDPNHIPGTLQSLSALFAPLAIGDRLLGVMSIQSPHAAAYAERERLVFRTLCAYGAIGLDNAATYRQLEATLGTLRDTQQQLLEKNGLLEEAYREQQRASLTDPLTGLHNRRYLLQHAEHESALALRRHRALLKSGKHTPSLDKDMVFFMIDIDHFKAVNDQFGHAAGDLVLVQMRERLQRVARVTDYLIRWGGEEFLVVARATNRLEAPLVAERLRRAVAEQPFDIGLAQALQKTCSIGFASFPFSPAHPTGLSWSHVVELADQALYMVKRNGRDGWVGLYATACTQPENLLQRISLDIDAVKAAGELHIVSSASSAPAQA